MDKDEKKIEYRGLRVNTFRSTRMGIPDKEWTRIEDEGGRVVRKDARWIGCDVERAKEWIDVYVDGENEPQ